MDWTATFLAVTGAKASPEYPLDGTNLIGVCTGEQAPFERTLFWRNNAYDAARMGNWKYLIENNTEHLFDLSTDPGEKFDLKEKETAVFSKIQAAYRGWNQSVLARPAAGARGQAPGAGARGQAPGTGARGGQRGPQ